MRRRCEKSDSADRVGGRAVEESVDRVPEELLQFANQKDSSEFAMNLGRPVPCEQGAADLWATASSADPRFLFVCLGFWILSLWFSVWGVGLCLVFCVFGF